MNIYILTIIVSVFFAYLAEKERKKYLNNNLKKNKIKFLILCCCSFILPFLVSALRAPSVGTDTSTTYVEIFNRILNNESIRDFGFGLIIKIITLFTNNYAVAVFITSLMICSLAYYLIFKESENPVLSVYLFFTTNIFFISMNMIRQTISIMLFILSIPYIKKRKFFKFLIIFLLAFSMHPTSIVFFPTYFLLNRKLRIKYITIFLLIFTLLRGVFSNIIINILRSSDYFMRYFNWYFSSQYNEGKINWISIAITGCILVLLYYINKEAKEDKDYNLFLWLESIAMFCLIFSGIIPLMQRIYFIFSFPIFIYLPKMLDFIKNNKIRLIFKYGIILGYTSYMIVSIFILGYHDVVPYISIFS